MHDRLESEKKENIYQSVLNDIKKSNICDKGLSRNKKQCNCYSRVRVCSLKPKYSD